MSTINGLLIKINVEKQLMCGVAVEKISKLNLKFHLNIRLTFDARFSINKKAA